MESKTIIEASGIHKSYSMKNGVFTRVLKDVSINITKGEFTAIAGASGAGKSTLLHLLASFDSPDSGEIIYHTYNGVLKLGNLKGSRISDFRNKFIGFIFQFHHLLPEFSCLENVMMPSLIAGESPSKAKAKAESLLESVGMSGKLKNKPAELSGGEQQRTAIARALINSPLIVFADEPTGNLDSENSSAVINLIKMLIIERNLTFVVATHSVEIAASAVRIYRIADGLLTEVESNQITK